MATSDDSEELPVLLGLMNTVTFDYLIGLFAGKVGGVQYEVGLIGKVPVPTKHDSRELSELAVKAYRAAWSSSISQERSHAFVSPLSTNKATLSDSYTELQASSQRAHTEVSEYARRGDEIALRGYGIAIADRPVIEISDSATDQESDSGAEIEEIDEDAIEHKPGGFVSGVVSYCLGAVFGRWDVRYATGEQQLPDLPDPFDPLPVCSPGMLTGLDGLPATDASSGYPLRVQWDGVLVDDTDHNSDIVRRVREVLELIWEDRADAIEKEACEILGVKDLRDYFRKPGKGGFWDDHIARYSKSRRKAPIYWLLQSSKKNYAIWLYCHRLDKDTLFKVLVNTVEPKVRNAERELTEMRTRRTTATGKDIKVLDRQIEKQDALVSELRDFEDKLRRAAELNLTPDLNDGVVLTIAPLRELVPWKEAKAYWEELLAGEYAWSSIGKQLREKGLVK
jgi:hypothetical protein